MNRNEVGRKVLQLQDEYLKCTDRQRLNDLEKEIEFYEDLLYGKE